MANIHRSGVFKKARLVFTIIIVGMVFAYFIGISLPFFLTKMINSRLIKNAGRMTPKIFVPTNPRGAQLLPPGIVVSETDYMSRRLWGDPSEDIKKKPKYLVTFTVGFDQRNNIDAAVKKFSDDFQILLFHYDGRTSEWDQYEWSKRAVHVSVRKQTKWWYAKRFLHPDVVAAYDYIFIWDEDLGVEHFNGDEYMELVKKHGLEISQPGLEPNDGITWRMTKRRDDSEVHKVTEEKPGRCSDPHLPPCAAFVEIMAPVFSREAWRCVWHMIQNDLVHGWGLDFALRRCVEPAHEKIGVVDSQWIIHQEIRSLGSQALCGFSCLLILQNKTKDQTDIISRLQAELQKTQDNHTLLQKDHNKLQKDHAQLQEDHATLQIQNEGSSEDGKAPRKGVRERCRSEWALFQARLAHADQAYLMQTGKG